MNLKSFHIVFITCSSALAAVVGAWAWNSTTVTPSTRLILIGGAFAAGAALLVYGGWFVRQFRRQP